MLVLEIVASAVVLVVILGVIGFFASELNIQG
jgi:hypothetical protein